MILPPSAAPATRSFERTAHTSANPMSSRLAVYADPQISSKVISSTAVEAAPGLLDRPSLTGIAYLFRGIYVLRETNFLAKGARN